MLWAYEIKLPSGMREQDAIEAPTIEVARQKLEARGEVLDLKKKPMEINIPGLGGSPTTKDVVIFARQFSTMIDAGLPLVQCLDILGSQAENKAFGKVIKEIKKEVESGKTLAEAMGEHPKVFDKLFTSLVHAGETGGVLDVIMQRLAVYKEKADELKKKIKSAMMYPMITIVIAAACITVLMTMVLPMFGKMFDDFGGTLPALTQNVIGLSDWFVANILYVFGGIAAAAIVYILIRRNKTGHRITDMIYIKVPVLGELIRKSAVATFCRTMSTMLQSGVSIMDGLEICASAAGNDMVEEALLKTREQIAQGKPMVEPLIDSGVFPSMVCSMIAVGEQAGALDIMLEKIADFYDGEVDTAVEGLTSMIEPFMMAFLGGTIGTIVIAMYLPIFDIINQV
ncbi:MAG: pilus assembly protein PilC [Myxococcales bacterium]|nr:pilus assembly protein PilC [Myxococcales bacterium]